MDTLKETADNPSVEIVKKINVIKTNDCFIIEAPPIRVDSTWDIWYNEMPDKNCDVIN